MQGAIVGRFKPKITALRDGQEVRIRTAEPRDAQQLVELFRSVVKEKRYTLVQPDEFKRTYEEEREQISEHLETPGNLCLVAEVQGVIRANAQIESSETRVESHFGDVGNVWVHRDYRRNGVGTALMEALVEWATDHLRLEKLGLFVLSSSTEAIGLYKKLGFEIEGRGVGDMKFGPGDYVDTVIMGLWVKPRT
jgi:ribosomal protein S18 acetylase RimI-like enzyme